MATGRKIQRNQPTATSVPQTGLFQPRPFAAPVQAEAASPQAAPTADVQAKLESQPTGDRLSRVDFSAPPPIQPKLTVGAAGDKYEQEADRVARQVVNRIQAPQVNFQSSQSNPVQRKISIQALGGEGGDVSSQWESQLNQAKGGGQPLSPCLREPMEREFGADFSGVRVHTGGQADNLAKSIQAKAFTTGQDVFFGQGEYQPGSRGGQELIAHELTHVVQQNGGAVQQTQLKSRGWQPPTAQTASKLPEDGAIQRMTVRNSLTASTLSAVTHNKHVEPAGTQQHRANNEYGSRTFVTQAADITTVVDANAHNFTEANGTKSARFDFNANVPVSQYMKTPPNLGAGQPAVQTINNLATNCEIGVLKTGSDQIQVTHFKMA